MALFGVHEHGAHEGLAARGAVARVYVHVFGPQAAAAVVRVPVAALQEAAVAAAKVFFPPLEALAGAAPAARTLLGGADVVFFVGAAFAFGVGDAWVS